MWATSGYASVAVANPYGLTALRYRGVKYYWVGISLLVLSIVYVAPLVAALRAPSFPGPTTPLPALALPNVPVPLLRVPTVHRLAPLPAVPHHARARSQRQATHPQRVIRRDALLQTNVAEKTFRPFIFPAHRLPQTKGIGHIHRITFQSPREATFSATC